MSKYIVNGLPWGSGIGKDVSDCKTSKEVMEKVGLNFTVEKCELMAKMPITIDSNTTYNKVGGEFHHEGNIYRNCPGAFATYRTDKNIPLGLVKDKYEIVQNLDAFKFFDDAIGEGKAKWDRIGIFGFGHKIFVSAKLPITTTVKGDPIDNYLVLSNSHDGSTSVNILFSPIRVYCTNMLNSAMKASSSYIRLRHTANINSKLLTGSEILKSSIQCAETAQELYESLQKIKMTDDQVMKYVSSIVLNEDEINKLENYSPVHGYQRIINKDRLTMETVGISARKVGIIANMFEYYIDGIGQQQIAGTAWGAYNAVTGFYSNVANLEGEKRVESLLWGSANKNMQNALVNAFDYE